MGFVGLGAGFVLLHLGLRYAGLGRGLFFVIDDIHGNSIVLRTSLGLWTVGILVLIGDLVASWRVARRDAEAGSTTTDAIPTTSVIPPS
jgi:hypothetical protein